MEFGKEHLVCQQEHSSIYIVQMVGLEMKQPGLLAEMQNGATCAPVTDYSAYTNRLITVGAITTTDTWGSCSPCVVGPVTGCTDSTSEITTTLLMQMMDRVLMT